ncbi:MAG: AI-2E family transporter, partial [Gammaproteobacteria bacterium]
MIVIPESGNEPAGLGDRVRMLLALTVLVLLILGCILVAWPFVTAIIWAAILAFSTWGFFSYLRQILGGRASLAALAMTLLIASIMVVPFLIVGESLADNIGAVVNAIRHPFEQGPQLPGWITGLPYVGPRIETYMHSLAHDPVARKAELQSLVDPLKRFGVKLGKSLGSGILQIILSLVICFFFYRDGDAIADRLERTAMQLGGGRGHRLLEIASLTVRGVVRGFIGTAIVQGILMGLGFWAASVPGAFLLGFLTFVFGFVPFGPMFLWAPAAIWLFQQGSDGWAIFTLIWGLAVGLGADHLLKPILISRLGTTPLLIVMIGVFGGALAFGFLGIFLGPTLLAAGYS